MSTPDELHQVLAVVGAFAPVAWRVPAEGQLDEQTSTLWADAPADDADSDESLAEFFMNTPELKN
jgi:hypothetical protein